MIRRILFLTLIGLVFSACSAGSQTQAAAGPTEAAAAALQSPVPSLTHGSATTVVPDFTQEPEFTATQVTPVSDIPTSAPPLATTHEVTQPPGGETVTIKTADGLEIAGSFYKPTEGAPPWPGVILLHMIYRSREDWEGPAQALAHAGYAALAIDMRGHGDTGGETDWTKTAEDLKQVWQYFAELPEVDETRTAFIGASMGANMALWAAAEQSEVKTAVLLSPGLSYFGVETEPAMEGYIGRPLLLVASKEDTYSAESSQNLASQAGDEAELVLYDGAGHGTDMFAQESGLIDTIIGWLERSLYP